MSYMPYMYLVIIETFKQDMQIILVLLQIIYESILIPFTPLFKLASKCDLKGNICCQKIK